MRARRLIEGVGLGGQRDHRNNKQVFGGKKQEADARRRYLVDRVRLAALALTAVEKTNPPKARQGRTNTFSKGASNG
jgi:hypothetical protein